MSQTPKIPRFYVDTGLYQRACGKWQPSEEHLPFVQLNPTNVLSVPPSTNRIKVPKITPITYAAFLGHNAGMMYPEWLNDGVNIGLQSLTEVVNGQSYATLDSVEHEGWSLWTFPDNDEADEIQAVFHSEANCGAVSFGEYYDMPHSPDVSLTLSYEYDGIKEQTTKGGSTLSNATYIKPADWGSRGAWQLGDNINYRSGRRVWSLSFSYITPDDIFPVNATTSNPLDANPDDNTLLNGTDFFSVVWNRTLAGHLPFIFQPDNSDNSTQNFAICKFDQNSLKVTQASPLLYSISLKIKEIW